MANIALKFSAELSTSDPAQHAVLIVGQLKHLLKLPYGTIKVKLEPRVSKEVKRKSVSVSTSFTDFTFAARLLTSVSDLRDCREQSASITDGFLFALPEQRYRCSITFQMYASQYTIPCAQSGSHRSQLYQRGRRVYCGTSGVS